MPDWKQHKFIVITREKKDNKILKEKLNKKGFRVFEYPAIRTVKIPPGNIHKKILLNLESYDLIIFTSAKAILYFIDLIKNSSYQKILSKIKIITIGSKTAKIAAEYGLKVNFIPSVFSKNFLAAELTGIKGLKILLPLSDKAGPYLIKNLIKKGGEITSFPIYATLYTKTSPPGFSKLVSERKIGYIFFTSPSTVKGFAEKIKNKSFFKTVLKIPVIAIGSSTAGQAKTQGFINVQTTNPHTTEAMIEKLIK